MRHSEEEFGDILFALVNWARYLHIDPAVALERANAKFRKRFTYVENKCRDRGIEMKKRKSSDNGCIVGRSKTYAVVEMQSPPIHTKVNYKILYFTLSA